MTVRLSAAAPRAHAHRLGAPRRRHVVLHALKRGRYTLTVFATVDARAIAVQKSVRVT